MRSPSLPHSPSPPLSLTLAPKHRNESHYAQSMNCPIPNKETLPCPLIRLLLWALLSITSSIRWTSDYFTSLVLVKIPSSGPRKVNFYNFLSRPNKARVNYYGVLPFFFLVDRGSSKVILIYLAKEVQEVQLYYILCQMMFTPIKYVCVCAQSCPTLCHPMDCSPPGSSVHGIFQARILEQVAISYSRGSSQSRDQTRVSCIGRGFLTTVPPGKPL